MVIGWIESVADLQDADVYDDRLQCVHRGRTESYLLHRDSMDLDLIELVLPPAGVIG